MRGWRGVVVRVVAVAVIGAAARGSAAPRIAAGSPGFAPGSVVIVIVSGSAARIVVIVAADLDVERSPVLVSEDVL